MASTFRNTAVIVVLIAAATSQIARAGSKVYVGSRVSSGRQVSMDRIDHSLWDALVRKYVDNDGMVDYQALKASSRDSGALDGYLKTLSTANPRVSASRDAQLAYWINAYNAVTLHGILREYPTSSIRSHTARILGYNIWKDLQLYDW